MKQTILGSGGAIGIQLGKELTKYTEDIRIVSRNPKKVNINDELIRADLLKKDQVFKAVDGSSIVYLTVGLPYKAKVWESDWPIVMANVIDACKTFDSKLVFFDNIYMYDPHQLSLMTEDTPVNPSSRKGKVRGKIASMLIHEFDKGDIEGLIARSADFYGPSINNSVILETVVKNLANGKKAIWIGDPKYIHSNTYTIDAAKATALLGNTPESYNQVWHLPTSNERITGNLWLELIAAELNCEPKYRRISKTIISISSPFVSLMSELKEMYYQNDRDYFFDSTKFNKKFNFTPTPYKEGIKTVINAYYKK